MGDKQNKTNSYTEFFYHAFRNILFVGIPLVIISAIILSVPHSSADISGGSTDNVRLTLSTSCTVNAVVTVEHEISLHGGQKDDNVGNTKLSAYCNDNNGYSIYAVGSSGDVDGNTDLINTISDEYNIHTGVYDSNSSINPSSWAMKLTAGTGTGIDPITGESVSRTPPTIINGYDNYSAIPSVYTQVAKRTSGTSMITDSDASGSYLNTTYQIHASSYQPAGTYNGKVKYVMVHPGSNNNTIPDIDAAFAIAGKQKMYQDSEGSYYAMQDMTSEICSMVTPGESTTSRLVDTRDKNLYYVTKEKDGNCWMTQNLDLKLNDPNTTPLTSENTDISTNPDVYTATPYATGYTVNDGVYTWMLTRATASATVDYTDNSVAGWNGYATAPVSAEGSDTYIYTNDENNNTLDNIYDSLQACMEASHTDDPTNCRHYHVGNYYNWTAAIASNNSTNFNTQYDNATNSICPKGWRLPIATDANNESREFGDLLVAQGIIYNTTATTYFANGFINIRKAPLWFVRGGYIYVTLSSSASNGYYLSSTVYDNNNIYGLSFGSGSAGSADKINRYFGYSIRCLAR